MKDAGKKHDAGKMPAHSPLAYFPRALEEVAKVCAHGEAIHGYDTWATIENAPRRYADADLRHELELCKGNTHDTGEGGSGLLHLSHRAWNLLALLELEMRMIEQNKD